MNYLAHIFLAGSRPPLIMGNFLADFLTNSEVAALPPAVQKGVRMHRMIDSFTDAHYLVRKGVQRLRPWHRKFAPVVLDICYDFILVKNWNRYSDEDIHFFTKNIYEILEENSWMMPPFLQKRLPKMIADDWLVKYGTASGLRFTFERIKKRTRYPQYFENAVDHFFKDYYLYEKEFNSFFPELIAAVAQW